ncbi:hypothetical protein AGJ34_20450 [Cronobacter dublinensis subsp. dublinensis]|nr:hypothetical protein [Cronobacter dublinensis subsp. dublinensis]EGT5729677.1 hypothetical protein [Cronobacter dublinensis subsp. dublinensis]
MSLNIKKLFAMRQPCKNCPFLKEHGIELVEGRLDNIKQDLLNDDQRPFFCHKTTYETGGHTDVETGNYKPSGQESYCMGAMAFLYARHRVNVPMRLGLAMGLLDQEDIKKAINFIEVD